MKQTYTLPSVYGTIDARGTKQAQPFTLKTGLIPRKEPLNIAASYTSGTSALAHKT